MSDFAKNVLRLYKELTQAHGFVPAERHSTLVSFVRYISEDVFAYVLIAGERSGPGCLSVNLRIAPPNNPDDGLSSLEIGYNIRIGGRADLESSYFTLCQQQIIDLIPALNCFSPIIRRQIESTDAPTRRRILFHSARLLYEKYLAHQGNQELYALPLQIAEQLANGKSLFSKLEAACLPVIQNLIQNNEFDPSLYGNDEYRDSTVALVLAQQLRIHELAKLSRNKI